MKKLLLITMLLGVGYSQCNESNWQAYYPDMAYCDLEGADLQYANLYMADLTGAHLWEANLEGANLIAANLHQTNLSGANLEWALLSSSILLSSNLTDANLTNTYCHGAFFVNANLWNTNFEGADLEYAYFDENEDQYDDVSYDAGATSADPCYGVVCDDDPEMICICGECTYEDEQGDTGGGDCSYGDECFEAGAVSGDLNLDGTDNVLDVVLLVNNILGS